MSDTVASLGFAVDSKPLDDAKASLKGLNDEAAKTNRPKPEPDPHSTVPTPVRPGARTLLPKSAWKYFLISGDRLLVDYFCERGGVVGAEIFRLSDHLGARTIPPTNERRLLHRWHDRDNPSSRDAKSVFLDGPDGAEKS